MAKALLITRFVYGKAVPGLCSRRSCLHFPPQIHLADETPLSVCLTSVLIHNVIQRYEPALYSNEGVCK